MTSMGRIAMTRMLVFRCMLALIILAVLVNGYFYFFNQKYLNSIFVWTVFFMLLGSGISYLNSKRLTYSDGKRRRSSGSLSRVWMLFSAGLLIWAFTNGLSYFYSLFYGSVPPYFTLLVAIDLVGYVVFIAANFLLAKFADLIRGGKTTFPVMKLAFSFTAISLVFLAAFFLQVVFGQIQSSFLITVYLVADALIAISILIPLSMLLNLSVQRPFALFISGFVLLLMAEISYFVLISMGLQVPLVGSPQHFIYMVAFGTFALGAYDQKRKLS